MPRGRYSFAWTASTATKGGIRTLPIAPQALSLLQARRDTTRQGKVPLPYATMAWCSLAACRGPNPSPCAPPGKPPSSGPISTVFAGMTCGIPPLRSLPRAGPLRAAPWASLPAFSGIRAGSCPSLSKDSSDAGACRRCGALGQAVTEADADRLPGSGPNSARRRSAPPGNRRTGARAGTGAGCEDGPAGCKSPARHARQTRPARDALNDARPGA